MKKVYVELNDTLIQEMFREEGWEVVQSLEEADLVCFSGGADVGPALYGERNEGSFSEVGRDYNSFVLWLNARRLEIPKVGICRGGQFLNVMAGGKMVQDYPGHAIHGTHEARDWKGRSWDVTSTHHQIMIPDPRWSEVLATTPDNGDEVEVAYHYTDWSLSFQPHPEYTPKGHSCRLFFFECLDLAFGVVTESL